MTESAECPGDRIVATYELHDTERSPEALAAAIALEQTVEVPQALVDASDSAAGRGRRSRASRHRCRCRRRRNGGAELRPCCGRGGRSAGAHQSRVRQRVDDARRAARGYRLPRPRARRIRRSAPRRGRRAGAHRRVRPPAARHRAQAARRSGEPARRDGRRVRTRRWRHRQGRSEPHRRLRGVQGPGEAVRRGGGGREPAHRTPLPVPALRHRPPARAHPPVRVRGTAGASPGCWPPRSSRGSASPDPSRATTT